MPNQNAALFNQNFARKSLFQIAQLSSDSLSLPFFDDFSYPLNNIYPDQRLWTDNTVFINNNYGKNVISQGVATFDHINAIGQPYGPLSKFVSVAADTLSSQNINLLDRIVGMNRINYSLSDSIYLSFFVQSGGYGDAPETQDSIVLQFLDNNFNWQSVWRLSGNQAPQFRQFFIGILAPRFLHGKFRFRFINFVKTSGNMNHYHLDYIQFAAARGFKDTLIQDVSFTRKPTGLLSKYSCMPYSHFKINPGLYTASSRKVYFRNNSRAGVVFASVQSESFNDVNTRIDFVPFTSRNLNINQNGDSTVTYSAFAMNTLVGDTPSIRNNYTINSPGNDVTEQSAYNSLFNNNSITQLQKFDDYYAYDDGSAEASFGLDYASLPNGPGFVAIKYTLAKADTFRGFDVFFNQAIEAVTFRPFQLILWKAINNASGKSNIVLARINAVPAYRDTIHGFSTFLLDSAIFLPAGDFFIGWQQNSSFILNIGWDENYNDFNNYQPEIYYDLLGFWQKLNPVFKGALMMRPLIDKYIFKSTKARTIDQLESVNIYPNPSRSYINITSNIPVNFQIIDMLGKNILVCDMFKKQHEILIPIPGLYFCITLDTNNHKIIKKILIQ